jgi:hypothetical protein
MADSRGIRFVFQAALVFVEEGRYMAPNRKSDFGRVIMRGRKDRQIDAVRLKKRLLFYDIL